VTTETTQTDRRAKKLRQIKLLLDKANATQYDEEADIFRARAEELMQQYRIDEWELAQAAPEVGSRPVWRTIFICEEGNPVYNTYVSLFFTVLRHAKCKGVYRYGKTDGQYGWVAEAVGFSEDLDYADALYTGLAVYLNSKVAPKVEPSRSRPENVHALKEAGMTWKDIFRALDLPFEDAYGQPTPERSQVYGEYQRWCKQHNKQPVKSNPKVYLRSFADAFWMRIYHRLQDIRDQQEQKFRNEIIGEKYALALADRSVHVDAAFEEKYPPHKIETTSSVSKSSNRRPAKYREKAVDHDAMNRGDLAARGADLGEGGALEQSKKELGR
jgi:hypothetical protein